jgi:mono/diheme cytochrome c family protein
MMQPGVVAGLALLGGVGLVGASLAALPTVATPEAITRGAAVYAEACAGCHGAALEGRIGPPLGAAGHAWRHTDAMLVRQIARGGAGMPGFAERLSKAEIDAVLGYLKSRWPAGLRAAQTARVAGERAAMLRLLSDPGALLPADCASDG